MKAIVRSGFRNHRTDHRKDPRESGGRTALSVRKAEEASLLVELQRTCQMGYWHHNLSGNKLTWSAGIYRICGVSRRQFKVTYEVAFQLIHPDDRSMVAQARGMNYRDSQGHMEVRYRMVQPLSGDIIFVRENCSTVCDKDGKIIGLRSIVQDETDFRKIRSELTEKNRMVGVLLDNLDGFAYRCLNDRNWTMEFMSRGVEEITGFPWSDFRDSVRSYNSIIAVEDRQRVWDVIQDALDKSEPFTLEYKIFAADGTIKWVWERGKGIYGEDGLEALEGYISDITTQKKQHARLSAIIAALPDLMFVMDRRGNFLEVHGADLNQLTLPREMVIGKNMAELFPPELARLHLDKIREAVESNALVTYEYRMDTEGHSMVREARVNLMNHDKVIVFVRDITQRKMAEEELKNLNANLEEIILERTRELNSFFDVTLDMLCIAGTHGYFLRLNKAWETHLGFTLAELLSKPFLEFVWPDDVEATIQAMQVLENRNHAHSFTNRFKTKSGGYRYIEWHSSLIGDKVYAAARDITGRIETETELRQAKVEAEVANRTKSEFLANMSHEIRTPMNAIIGYSELLTSIVQHDTEREYLESIKSSGKTLMTLINDILDLSKIEAGKLELVYAYVDTLEFFREFERIFAFKLREKRLLFALEIDPTVPASIYIDCVRLRQIILNLIGNAIKFTDAGKISLRIRSDHFSLDPGSSAVGGFTDLTVEVEDTGMGIPEEACEKVFQSFYQVNSNKGLGGTGLGLTITRDLVKMMKGAISLDSVPGKGTKVTICLRQVACHTGRTPQADSAPFDPETIRFESGCLLVVDDMIEIRKFIRDVLKDSRIRLYEADSVATALKILEKVRPDLVISDIRMPGQDGFRLMGSIMANPSLQNIPVVAFSASVMKQEMERIRDHGFKGILTKPVRLEDLYKTLMQYLPYQCIIKHEKAGQEAFGEPAEWTNCKDLVDKLTGSFRAEMRDFESRQPMGKIRDFGTRICDLGERHRCNRVIVYGHDLVRAADDFNISRILEMLQEYESLVAEVSSRV